MSGHIVKSEVRNEMMFFDSITKTVLLSKAIATERCKNGVFSNDNFSIIVQEVRTTTKSDNLAI